VFFSPCLSIVRHSGAVTCLVPGARPCFPVRGLGAGARPKGMAAAASPQSLCLLPGAGPCWRRISSLTQCWHLCSLRREWLSGGWRSTAELGRHPQQKRVPSRIRDHERVRKSGLTRTLSCCGIPFPGTTRSSCTCLSLRTNARR
jgi:hypothetical protein